MNIVYRKIFPHLFGGAEVKATRFNKYRIAEPEKGLLDRIYLSRQEGLPTPLDELQLQPLHIAKLVDYAERFPRTVREIVKELVISRSVSYPV